MLETVFAMNLWVGTRCPICCQRELKFNGLQHRSCRHGYSALLMADLVKSDERSSVNERKPNR